MKSSCLCSPREYRALIPRAEYDENSVVFVYPMNRKIGGIVVFCLVSPKTADVEQIGNNASIVLVNQIPEPYLAISLVGVVLRLKKA